MCLFPTRSLTEAGDKDRLSPQYHQKSEREVSVGCFSTWLFRVGAGCYMELPCYTHPLENPTLGVAFAWGWGGGGGYSGQYLSAADIFFIEIHLA